MKLLARVDARQIPLADASVQCVVTSPPYWGLRCYGVDGQLGLEKTPEEYVANMVAVFREVRRVLRDDGTLWLNLGDSYAADRGGTHQPAETAAGGRHGKTVDGERVNRGRQDGYSPSRNAPAIGLKHKDLVGIPWRVAFALQADGWTLRSDIVWSKPNPMPESVTDRPTKAHEMLFLFSKAKWTGPRRGRFAHLSEQDARWLALFLDTEGSIVVKRVEKESGRRWYGAQVSFASTSTALMDAARAMLGQGSVHERPGKNAPMFYYQLSNQAARDLLYVLYPHLIVKQRQAALAIHVQDLLSPGGKTRPGGFRHPAHSETLERAWLTMKDLNHFGEPDLAWVPAPVYGRWTSARYYYDAEAVKELAEYGENRATFRGGDERVRAANLCGGGPVESDAGMERPRPSARNRRSVWTIATQPYSGAHFATFPEKLVEPCVLAGSAEGDTVLDPFAGSGTTVQVANRLRRKGVGLDLSADYLALAKKRTAEVQMELA